MLAAWLSGCAALASDQAVIGCQAADAATTVVALQRGAVEANPIWRAVLEHAGVGGFLFLKVALTVALVKYADDGARAVVNVATCAGALNNARVIRSVGLSVK